MLYNYTEEHLSLPTPVLWVHRCHAQWGMVPPSINLQSLAVDSGETVGHTVAVLEGNTCSARKGVVG